MPFDAIHVNAVTKSHHVCGGDENSCNLRHDMWIICKKRIEIIARYFGRFERVHGHVAYSEIINSIVRCARAGDIRCINVSGTPRKPRHRAIVIAVCRVAVRNVRTAHTTHGLQLFRRKRCGQTNVSCAVLQIKRRAFSDIRRGIAIIDVGQCEVTAVHAWVFQQFLRCRFRQRRVST